MKEVRGAAAATMASGTRRRCHRDGERTVVFAS